MSLKNKTIPKYSYSVTFGVKQIEKIEKECNEQNKTPKAFIKEATISAAKNIIKKTKPK